MCDQLEIKYYGHSCFLISYKGYAIAIDPYAPYVPGYPLLKVVANEVICSHEHQDHHYEEAVDILKTNQCNPFHITQFEVPHDEANGTLRGNTKITKLEAGDFCVVHFGDVGCMPDASILESVHGADIIMIPVGGFYTVDAVLANQIAEAVDARVVIPMHYRIGDVGFPVLAEVQDFLCLRNDVRTCQGNSAIIKKQNHKETILLSHVH